MLRNMSILSQLGHSKAMKKNRDTNGFRVVLKQTTFALAVDFR